MSAPASSGENGEIKTFLVDDCRALVEGLTVDIYTYSATSSVSAALSDKNKAVRIKHIDRNAKKISIEGENISVTTRSSAAESYGFLVVQGSYNKELIGLKAIFDDAVPTLYGCGKAENPFMVPLKVDAQHSISDSLIYDAVKNAADYRNSKINLVMMGDDAFKAYQDYMRENNVLVCDKANFVGGSSGYQVMVGNRVVTVINERLVPAKEAWCVDTDAFLFTQLEFDFCNYGSSGVFQLIPGTSYYRALLATYGNLICKNPGGCVKIVNCAQA
jgi:hypothetical protein